MLFCKWEVYEYVCLRVPHSRNKAFVLTVEWPSFPCLELAWSKVFEKIHCMKCNGCLKLTGWISTSQVLPNGLHVPHLYFRLQCVPGHSGPGQPGNRQRAAGPCEQQSAPSLLSLLCLKRGCWPSTLSQLLVSVTSFMIRLLQCLIIYPFAVWTCKVLALVCSLLKSVIPEPAAAAASSVLPVSSSGWAAAVRFACFTSKVWFVDIFALFLLSAAEERKRGGVCTQPLAHGWGKRGGPPREGRNYKELPD